ncbi:MAG: hypothetical protein RR404_02210 [Bacilli bacterium]
MNNNGTEEIKTVKLQIAKLIEQIAQKQLCGKIDDLKPLTKSILDFNIPNVTQEMIIELINACFSKTKADMVNRKLIKASLRDFEQWKAILNPKELCKAQMDYDNKKQLYDDLLEQMVANLYSTQNLKH